MTKNTHLRLTQHELFTQLATQDQGCLKWVSRTQTSALTAQVTFLIDTCVFMALHTCSNMAEISHPGFSLTLCARGPERHGHGGKNTTYMVLSVLCTAKKLSP